MWDEVENYRLLQEQYEAALREYTREESHYRELLARDPDDPTLKSRYERLQELRHEVDSRYKRLTDIRRDMANRQGKAMGSGA